MSNLIQVRPALNYQFDKASTPEDMLSLIKSYGGTFTRANNTATFINKFGLIETVNANLPRPDHDPVTLVNKALLIEEQRTNINARSEDFELWENSAGTTTITDNSVKGPDGNLSASTINTSALNANNEAGRTKNIVYTGSTVYSVSVYGKAGTSDRLRFGIGDGVDFGTIDFLFSTQTFTNKRGGLTLSNESHVTLYDGWFRLHCLITTSSGAGAGNMGVLSAQTGTLYVYGAQCEQGSFPTSYIPTSGSTATRSADVAVIDNVGTPDFDNLYNPQEGTFLAEFSKFGGYTQGGTALVIATDGTPNNRIGLADNATGGRYGFFAIAGGVSQFSSGTTFPNITNENLIKFAGAYSASEASARNGTITTYDASGSYTLPIVDRIGIGTDISGVSAKSLNGHLKRLVYYPKALTDAQLAKLTRTTT